MTEREERTNSVHDLLAGGSWSTKKSTKTKGKTATMLVYVWGQEMTVASFFLLLSFSLSLFISAR